MPMSDKQKQLDLHVEDLNSAYKAIFKKCHPKSDPTNHLQEITKERVIC